MYWTEFIDLGLSWEKQSLNWFCGVAYWLQSIDILWRFGQDSGQKNFMDINFNSTMRERRHHVKCAGFNLLLMGNIIWMKESDVCLRCSLCLDPPVLSSLLGYPWGCPWQTVMLYVSMIMFKSRTKAAPLLLLTRSDIPVITENAGCVIVLTNNDTDSNHRESGICSPGEPCGKCNVQRREHCALSSALGIINRDSSLFILCCSHPRHIWCPVAPGWWYFSRHVRPVQAVACLYMCVAVHDGLFN